MFDESTKLCDVKYKIVFLGQSAVGKSAIIERFIRERFDACKSVCFGPYVRKHLVLIFLQKMCTIRVPCIVCNCGTPQANKNSKAWSPIISEMHIAQFLYMISRGRKPSMVLMDG